MNQSGSIASTAEDLASAHARLNFVDGQMRLRSVSLLLVGSLSGLTGFLLVAGLSLYSYMATVQINFLGRPFESGHNYFPQTVAEGALQFRNGEATVYFAFCFVAGVCLLMSWYPSELRNVYVGYNAIVCGAISWLNLRLYVPSISLMLMACIPISRHAEAGVEDGAGQVNLYIHVLLSLTLVGSYIACEVHALSFSSVLSDVLSKREKRVRWLLVLGCLTFFILFELCGLVYGILNDSGVCCGDVWKVPSNSTWPTASDPVEAAVTKAAAVSHRHELYDTAKGTLLAIKMLQYFFQILACLMLILSHLAIWYFCPERRLSLDTELPDPGGSLYMDPGSELIPDKSTWVDTGPALPTFPSPQKRRQGGDAPSLFQIDSRTPMSPEVFGGVPPPTFARTPELGGASRVPEGFIRRDHVLRT